MNNQVIILNEIDGRDDYFHGAVMAPDNTSDAETEAKRIWSLAMDSSEDWTYDDVLEAFERAGWTRLNASRVYEDDVY